ncbi:hypothetical protein Hypma_002924 [Hypsizygus marmoreus]|uniref:F-box domain-containing protein n=1 Tax=Hypsizygus marmoreus TaxID=39966 RepID=A0A369J4W3_HYPMA|nr:hypothetical protein Hypma_002924 [Hypsizygus marmoreus]
MDPDVEESRYEHLMLTNDEPQSLELQEIRTIVKRRQSSLAQIDTQLIELLRSVKSVLQLRRREKRVLSRFHCILSPIRRLPRELLVEIFLFSRYWPSETDDFGRTAVGPGCEFSLLSITHVCSEWRRVALTTPALWATIYACHEGYDPTIPRSDPIADEYLQTWLSRSGTRHPLDVTVIGPPNRIPCPISWIEPYIHRLKTLTLEGAVTALPDGSFDMLEMLSIDDYDSHAEVNSDRIFFPSLHRLVLLGSFLSHPLTFVALAQLTHLSLEMDSIFRMSIFLEMLSQSKALVWLEVTLFEDPDVGDAELIRDDERVVMNHLQTLITHTPTTTTSLLPYLTLPALKILNLAYDAWPASIYNSLQSRSSFPLQSLTMMNWRRDVLDPAEFLAILLKLPLLKEFISRNALAIDPTLLHGLTSTSPDGVPDIAPNLEYFGLSVDTQLGIVVDNDLVLEMVASRDSSGKPAITEPNQPPHIRIFRSQLPKRWSDGKLHKFPMKKPWSGSTSESVHICF